MSDSDKALSKYIEKMYEIQYSQKDNILSDAELKEIALNMGISEEEWNSSEQVFADTLATGKELILQQNYADATEKLESAVALKPYHANALCFLAQAQIGMYKEAGLQVYATKAEAFIDRCLRVDPRHKQALKLLNELRQEEKGKQKSKGKAVLIVAGVLVVVLAIAGMSYMGARNNAIQQEEKVAGAWAQVENVYQRRADLIPQLVKVVKQSASFEKEKLDKVLSAYKALSKQNGSEFTEKKMDVFQRKQVALSEALHALSDQLKNNSEIGTLKAYQDLQTQIEGAENRISVERRKFNKAVQAYNSYIKQFPQSIMGFDEKPYFEVDTDAMKVPSLD